MRDANTLSHAPKRTLHHLQRGFLSLQGNLPLLEVPHEFLQGVPKWLGTLFQQRLQTNRRQHIQLLAYLSSRYPISILDFIQRSIPLTLHRRTVMKYQILLSSLIVAALF